MKRLIGKVVRLFEENEHYVVMKHGEGFRIFHKYKNTSIYCDKYVILNSTIVYTNEQNTSFVYSFKQRRFLNGDIAVYIRQIESWGYKNINGVEKLYIKYKSSNEKSILEFIDKDGNIFNPTSENTQENINILE